MERMVNNYVAQQKFSEGKTFLNGIMDKILVIGAPQEVMTKIDVVMNVLKEEEQNELQKEEELVYRASKLGYH